MFIATVMAFAAWHPARASDQDDARGLFLRFMSAQNAHDATAVAALLWKSPDVLWFTRGVEVRGVEAITKTLTEYYLGTWHVEPDMSYFNATVISSDSLQILVPIEFTRGSPGAAPQANTFLISQTLVRTPDGWRIAAIVPVANTKLK